ncbi:hypothetical protein A9Q98_06335 [Thalassotalea sp. 42_200_T64]|nr:hypothetical protein A9Q98_06335 [Thalassotalea sp. 42_200_T64]
MKNRIVCWFSCGAASAVATKMMIAKSNDNQELVIAYCEVEEEHPDNKRFLKECEIWFGQKIIILRNEYYKGSIYNVFESNYMRTPAGSPCTRALKKQVRQKFQKIDDVHVFGYTAEEENRLNNFIDANNEIDVYSPLIDRCISKENCLSMIENAGIELPTMYKQGYPHNNCVGCVKGGMGYWNKIRVDYPETFNRMAKLERRKGYTVLKEPKTGKPLFLDDLDPNRGRMSEEPNIECGIFCHAEEQIYNAVRLIKERMGRYTIAAL